MNKKICIYHGNCADGFSGAWVVRKALGDIEFHAGVYQNPPPDVTNKDVILVDFSYKKEVILKMMETAKSILILDHHKTAIDDLDELFNGVANLAMNDNEKRWHAVFDINRAGSMIAWDYYFPKIPPPKILEHIQDRDLWRFALEGTREIQANIFSYPYDFNVWDMLLNTSPKELALEGAAIERKHFKDIDELLLVTTRRMNIGGINVPIANLPYTLVSDAAHKLGIGEPFAGCYWDTPKGRVFGLRSHEDGADVSEIAKQYGGGGHKHASGFSVSFEIANTFEVNYD